ncbi:MAG TPA: tRNA epoxyqueuosine(34) reductase QueG [Leptospiraceae bacterium]|nr:tRNA epoxyqueuosine(34) reductase QueG [Leptospiraceae bacterium]HNN59630.1 tRNA epoxyqueuosine(34) reductase QueG [Leptospiraceae bacterium]
MQAQAVEQTFIETALSLGFDLAAIAPISLPEKDTTAFKDFVAEGRHGTMEYLARNLELRLDPRSLMHDAKSALVLGSFYRTPESDAALENARVKIARYAHTGEYHDLLRERGRKLGRALKQKLPGLRCRFCIDTAPLAERVLGRLAGLGFQGKNTNLIHPGRGSFFFISVLLIGQELKPGVPALDRCGSCRICIDACPTGALTEYKIDARKCISYLTIERRSPMPDELRPHVQGWMFGCDVCQEVCPYNRTASYGAGWPSPDPGVVRLMESASEESLEDARANTPLGRPPLDLLKQSLQIAKESLDYLSEKI